MQLLTKSSFFSANILYDCKNGTYLSIHLVQYAAGLELSIVHCTKIFIVSIHSSISCWQCALLKFLIIPKNICCVQKENKNRYLELQNRCDNYPDFFSTATIGEIIIISTIQVNFSILAVARFSFQWWFLCDLSCDAITTEPNIQGLHIFHAMNSFLSHWLFVVSVLCPANLS